MNSFSQIRMIDSSKTFILPLHVLCIGNLITKGITTPLLKKKKKKNALKMQKLLKQSGKFCVRELFTRVGNVKRG